LTNQTNSTVSSLQAASMLYSYTKNVYVHFMTECTVMCRSMFIMSLLGDC